MITAKGLTFSYGDGPPVLVGVDIEVDRNEIVALLGPSGCGKSTLLRLLAGLEGLQGGELSKAQEVRQGFVFQEPALMPWATVAENVALPHKIAARVSRGLVQTALSDVEMAGFDSRYPEKLSGGQKMRVSIARALAAEPNLVFLDEPFAALDEILRFKMNELLMRVKTERQLSCVFVTHSLYEAAYLADRILVMKAGIIEGELMPKLDRTIPAAEQRGSQRFIDAVNQASRMLGAGDV